MIMPFVENSEQLAVVNNFRKKAPPQIFNKGLYTLLNKSSDVTSVESLAFLKDRLGSHLDGLKIRFVLH